MYYRKLFEKHILVFEDFKLLFEGEITQGAKARFDATLLFLRCSSNTKWRLN